MTTSPQADWPLWRSQLDRCLKAVFVAYCLCAAAGFLFVVTGLFRMLSQARVDRTELDIKNIATALKLYRKKIGRYPTTAEGLHVLVSCEVLESLPTDPWNFEYHYALRGDIPRVWSNGADGIPGGEGADADIPVLSPLPPWMEERVTPPLTHGSSASRCW